MQPIVFKHTQSGTGTVSYNKITTLFFGPFGYYVILLHVYGAEAKKKVVMRRFVEFLYISLNANLLRNKLSACLSYTCIQKEEEGREEDSVHTTTTNLQQINHHPPQTTTTTTTTTNNTW